MTRRLSISALADVNREEVVFLPLGENASDGSPRICLSLRKAGDMKRPTAGDGANVADESHGSLNESEPAPNGWNQRRLDFLGRLGIESRRVAAIQQIHSQGVVVVEDAWSPATEGDGLLTADPRFCLAVTVADCLPVFLHDKRSGAFALVHSGWRGTGIALVALQRMARRFGTNPGDVSAVVGPGIGACCYRVSEERAELFRQTWGEDSVVVHDGGVHLDLPAINERMLALAGVRDLTLISDCTSCNDFLGSFRREGPEQYTRMLALIGHFG